jgi:ERCC4-type nuclease
MVHARRPKPGRDKFLIIRDTREQAGHGWNFRASANCLGVEKKKLDVGDYTVSGLEDKLMVERKSLGDLWNTLGQQKNYERFLREMERAKDHRLKYLVIEATLAQVDSGYKWSKVSPANLHAKLISLQVNHNLHVIFAGREDKARTWTRRLFDKVFRYHLEDKL